MQVRIVTSANTSQARAEFAALERQVAALNAEMFKSTVIPGKINPQGFANMQRALDAGSRTFRNAIASSGQYHTEQLKINSATQQYTELLSKQKLSMRDIVKNQRIMKAAYREQLAIQQMAVRTTPSSISDGRRVLDIAVPTNVSKELDTIRQRMGWINALTASASQQMINWGKNTQWAGRQLMVGFTMPIAAFGAATGVLAYNVDKQMVRIQKVYDTTADANNTTLKGQMAVEKELAQVRNDSFETARLAAREYGAAVNDTLEIQAELAATGKKGNELQEATSEVMRISMLGELDRQVALKASIALQSIMGLSSRELAQQFNYLNAVENATSLATEDFAKAIPIALGPLKEMGGDVQDLGLLLVAMKQRGIEAGEGANAIKAMMQRLYRPSKQIREEWQALAGINLFEVRDRNKGNVMGMLKDIQEATAGMSQEKKVPLIGGLIGSYQVSRINAVLNGLKDLETGVGQTSKVLEINGQDFTEWADIAERETERWQESASGRFKRTLETFKIELAKMGEPFLAVGSTILSFLTKMAVWFNDLPDMAKKGTAIAIMIAAVIGPLVMLVGLFANFTGNIGKMVTTLANLGLKFNVITKESKAAALAAELTEAGFISEAKAVQLLTAEINALTQAQAASARQSVMMVRGARVAEIRRANPGISGSDIYRQMADERRAHLQSTGQMVGGVSTSYLATKNDSDRKEARAAESARSRATQQKIITSQVAAEAKIRQNIERSMSGAAVAGGALAASSILMMTTSNQTANNIANWIMIAAIAVPAVKAMVGPMQAIATAAKTAAAAQLVSNAASAGSAGNLVKAAGAAGTMRAGLLGGFKAFSKMMGPIGWAITAATVIGGLWYKNHKAEQKAKEEQEKLYRKQVEAQIALNNSTKQFAENTGKAIIQLDKLRQAGTFDLPNTPFEGTVEKYKSDQWKAERDALTGMINNSQNTSSMSNYQFGMSEVDLYSAKKFFELQEEMGLSAAEAAQEIKAMYIAAGMGMTNAGIQVQMLQKYIGDTSKMTAEQREQFIKMMGDQTRYSSWIAGKDGKSMVLDEKVARSSVQAYIKFVNDALADSQSKVEFNEILFQLDENTTSAWYDAFEKLNDDSRDALATMGVDTWQKYMELVKRMKTDALDDIDKAGLENIMSSFPELFDFENGMATKSFEDVFAKPAGDALKFEKIIAETLAKSYGLEGTFNNIADVLADPVFKTKWEPIDQKLVDDFKLQVENFKKSKEVNATGMSADQWDARETKIIYDMNQWLVSHGLPEVKSLQEGILALERAQKGELQAGVGGIKRQISAADELRNALAAAFSFDAPQMKTMLFEGMGGVQNDIADKFRSNFDEGMNRALDARQKMWDNRANALSNEMERRQNALDNKWENRRDAAESYWDRRLAGIDNAIKAEQRAEDIRKRIFDAELQRIQRLTDAQNRNIDFNMALNEGSLDEAAKIRNDMEATAAEWALSDAGEASQSQAEARIAGLEARKDTLEQQRDRHLRSLEKQEEAERNHLERVRQMREAALRRQTDADMAANRKEWENRKQLQEQRLALFLAYTAQNEADLKRHMASVGLSYKDFGDKVLKPMGLSWSEFFKNSLTEKVREAGLKIASDKMWESLGNESAQKILLGIGFKSMQDFSKFIKDGVLPKIGNMNPFNHEGGWAGQSSSRKGVARTQRGLHPSEINITAQKGEFVVNRRAAKENAGLLQDINAGKFSSKQAAGYGGAGGAVVPGIAGLVSAAAGHIFMSGVGAGIKNVFNASGQGTSGAGVFGQGKPGRYGDMDFNAEQLRNAKTIANVGRGMNMSSRDIEIGIMTAITESMLRNVKYGDRDSLGLFQQRPSQGWGTPAQVTDPVYAAGKFFNALKGVTKRNEMSPWQAAQAVQRSAFSDGSNYQKYWNEANAIFKGMRQQSNGNYVMSDLVQGRGGKHWPLPRGYRVTRGLHDTGTAFPGVDFAAPGGTPIYSAADGKVVVSKDLRNADGSYRSYGRYIVVDHGGVSSLYAHMSKRYANVGAYVKGGTKIGAVGTTGHSTGNHLHFGTSNGNPYSMLQLQKGAANIKWDNTIANLHKGEAVLTEDLNRKFHQGVENFANGGNSEYNFIINGQHLSADDIANVIFAKIKREENRKPKGRK